MLVQLKLQFASYEELPQTVATKLETHKNLIGYIRMLIQHTKVSFAKTWVVKAEVKEHLWDEF